MQRLLPNRRAHIRSATIDDVTLLRALIRGRVAFEPEPDLVSIQESDLGGTDLEPVYRGVAAVGFSLFALRLERGARKGGW